MTVKCKICGDVKEDTEFYKSNKSTCKVCVRKRNNDNYRNLGNGYDFTFKGVIRVLYKTMKRHQKLRGNGDLPFDKEDFKSWLMDNNYEGLYRCWVKNNHDSDLKPSVDRLDDYKGYTFDNMRLVTWKDNRNHQVSDRVSGNNKSGEVCIPLQKLNTSGNVLIEYTSYQEVRRVEGYCVHYAIKTGQPCKKGFTWRLKP